TNVFPSERGAGGARPLWKRGAWVRIPPFRFSARGPTVGQWSVKPRRFGASGFDSRLAVVLRITASDLPTFGRLVLVRRLLTTVVLAALGCGPGKAVDGDTVPAEQVQYCVEMLCFKALAC